MAKQRGPDGVPFDVPSHMPPKEKASPRHGADQNETVPPKRGRLFPEEPPTKPHDSAGAGRARGDFFDTETAPPPHKPRNPQPEPAATAPASDEPRTRIYRGGSGAGAAQQSHAPHRGAAEEPGAGRAQEAMEDPVTGWLVVIDGPGKGSFVRVGHGQNQIGRGAGARIRLDFGDALISRDNNGVITYDPLNRKFYVQQGTGTNLLYMNATPVLTPAELPDRAVLGVGETKLVFVAFCGQGFSWLGE